MDTNKTSNKLNTHLSQIPSAQLWIGPHNTLVEKATAYLQKIFCKSKGCNICTNCIQIRDQQHHTIIWLYPEKQYTLDQIDNIIKTISFALDNTDTFFFVLQKADFMPSVCANRLLKPIEEPPKGYHFLLLAERMEQILPTIRSRCTLKSFYTKDFAKLHPELFSCFISTKKQSPLHFMKILQASKINERESIELIDMLLKYWIKKYKNAAKKNNSELEKTYTIITKIKQQMLQLPMPGSSKLFWKNLFLQIHT